MDWSQDFHEGGKFIHNIAMTKTFVLSKEKTLIESAKEITTLLVSQADVVKIEVPRTLAEP